MTHDILLKDSPELRAKAKEQGITALTIGEELQVVSEAKEVRETASLLVLGDNAARGLVESPVDGVISLENEPRKDKLHYRRSGLDQVSARILAEQGKSLIIAYTDLKNSRQPEIALGRMHQNVAIARTTGLPIILVSGAKTPEELPRPHDLQAFWRAMGIPDEVVTRSEEELTKMLSRAKTRASQRYIAEGVERTD